MVCALLIRILPAQLVLTRGSLPVILLVLNILRRFGRQPFRVAVLRQKSTSPMLGLNAVDTIMSLLALS